MHDKKWDLGSYMLVVSFSRMLATYVLPVAIAACRARTCHVLEHKGNVSIVYTYAADLDVRTDVCITGIGRGRAVAVHHPVNTFLSTCVIDRGSGVNYYHPANHLRMRLHAASSCIRTALARTAGAMGMGINEARQPVKVSRSRCNGRSQPLGS